MARLTLSISRRARHDLQTIWQYTSREWSTQQANAYLQNLQDKFDLLCDTPLIAREHTVFTPVVRAHPSGQHLILYFAESGKLRIVRILHKRHDWRSILQG